MAKATYERDEPPAPLVPPWTAVGRGLMLENTGFIRSALVRSTALVTVIAVTAVFGPTAAVAHRRTATYCPAHFMAHRGEGWPTPNTDDGINAITAALRDPRVYGVESDVWETKDHKGLMQHGDNLAISTNGTGKVSDHTLAAERANIRMNDGSKPESLPEYLRQVVAAKKHAILHVKSTGARFDAYVSRALAEAKAHAYVRPMAITLTAAKYFVSQGWITELTVNGAARQGYVRDVKSSGVAGVLVVDSATKTRTPSTWIEPYIEAGISTDYVSYNSTQDTVVNRYRFDRVLSGDMATTERISGCTADRK